MSQNFDFIKPEQSHELLKELHILTRDGKINQDSRRKLKQVYHLYHFIEPLMNDSLKVHNQLNIVDHGAGKSYLGFILYDLFMKNKSYIEQCKVYGVETRPELVTKSKDLSNKLGFKNMDFLNLSVEESLSSKSLPEKIQIVTALHACDTATDDAIRFGLLKHAEYMVLVPCCQAEVARTLNQYKNRNKNYSLAEIWRHPMHTREFGSHITNVLRCLQLEAFGYQVTVTEFVGLDHSMKNELIIAKKIERPRVKQSQRILDLLNDLDLMDLKERFFTPEFENSNKN